MRGLTNCDDKRGIVRNAIRCLLPYFVVVMAMGCVCTAFAQFQAQINTGESVVDFMNRVEADLSRIDAQYNQQGNQHNIITYPNGQQPASPLDSPMMKAIDASCSQTMSDIRKIERGDWTAEDERRLQRQNAQWAQISASIEGDAARQGAYTGDRRLSIRQQAFRANQSADQEYLRKTGRIFNPQGPATYSGPEYEAWKEAAETHRRNEKYLK